MQTTPNAAATDCLATSKNVKRRDKLNRDTNLRVLGISGSLRKASFNSGLLRAAREVSHEEMEITIFDIKGLPFYDGDVEALGDPPSVTALKSAIRDADAVIFATPEYNWGTSGALKNAIDWASRDREEGSLMGKPATIIGAGGRAGTARAQMQLHETLAETGSVVMVKPGVLVQAFSPMRFDSEGNLIDDETKELLRSHLEAFAIWTLQLIRPREIVQHACEMDIHPARA
ncbi:MAG: NAD(P)H-dependent oxidoreductase [Chloroflexi bacterium]|nr:NAD(P)H-dependent oxidoreductase [Chloroflexota bacterium]